MMRPSSLPRQYPQQATCALCNPPLGFTLFASLLILLALSAIVAVGLRLSLQAQQAAQQESLQLRVQESAHLALVNAERSILQLAPLTNEQTDSAAAKQLAIEVPRAHIERFAEQNGQAPLYRIQARAVAYGSSSGLLGSAKKVEVRLESIYSLEPYPVRLSWSIIYD